LLQHASFGINVNMNKNSAKSTGSIRNVVFVLFEKTKLIDVTGPLQVFNDARLDSGPRPYGTILVSEQGGPIMTDAGILLATQRIREIGSMSVDTVLVSGGHSAIAAASSETLLLAISDLARHSRRIGSVCLGAFILAKAGYLDGRRATTHWELCHKLKSEYPMVRVQDDSIFEKDGCIWTSAGVTSGIDMALAMVEEDLGRKEAMRLARSLVLYLKRPGGQRQFSDLLRMQERGKSERFDSLLSWMTSSLSGDLSVPRLAEKAVMSERTFMRTFSKQFGTTPTRFVENLRVSAACKAIEGNECSLKQAVQIFGFQSPQRMRTAFHRQKGVSPLEYQIRFGGVQNRLDKGLGG
jgi:transcriptional regulator GlxA family with amidase domain